MVGWIFADGNLGWARIGPESLSKLFLSKVRLSFILNPKLTFIIQTDISFKTIWHVGRSQHASLRSSVAQELLSPKLAFFSFKIPQKERKRIDWEEFHLIRPQRGYNGTENDIIQNCKLVKIYFDLFYSLP